VIGSRTIDVVGVGVCVVDVDVEVDVVVTAGAGAVLATFRLPSKSPVSMEIPREIEGTLGTDRDGRIAAAVVVVEVSISIEA
jgi:hypothetical protein